MSALILDAGAFVALERGDKAMIARLKAAKMHGLQLRTCAIVPAQVWRDPHGRQAHLARLLQAVEVAPLDEPLGRLAGVLLGKAGTDDPIDAALVLTAQDGDTILTSDPMDIRRLAAASGRRVAIIVC